jgi:UDP-N-acetylmuramyl-tripeptide synthetase
VNRPASKPSLATEEGARAILAELQAAGVTVKRLINDSRRVQAGDVFVAYPGAKADGRMFIDEVIERGAAAVLAEAAGLEARSAAKVPVLAVDDLRAHAGELAALVYGRPSSHLRLLGVTGTNGKTSTTHWIATTLAAAGQRCATIGTLGNGFPGDLDESANTTPDALALHALLARYRQGGAAACTMEVSSIGLDQSRCAGARFAVAVFTNLTRDHLDYHGSMDAYARAKETLFVWPELETAVINLDDPFGSELLALTTARRKIVYSMHAENADPANHRPCDIVLRGENIEDRAEGIRFGLSVNGRLQWVEAPVIGHYNVANLLAVAGALLASGVPEERLSELLGGVHPVAGRMQRYGGAQAPLVAVDYAHTPDALANALAALRPAAKQRGGRLVCVFGCGGDRDRGKRPLMGEVATQGADQVWLTSDNPRSEEPLRILEDIAAGAGQRALRELDRSVAITRAIGACSERDVVLVAGKGHENYQEVHGRKLPYNDSLVVNAALAAWLEAQEQKPAAAVSPTRVHERKAGDE